MGKWSNEKGSSYVFSQVSTRSMICGGRLRSKIKSYNCRLFAFPTFLFLFWSFIYIFFFKKATKSAAHSGSWEFSFLFYIKSKPEDITDLLKQLRAWATEYLWAVGKIRTFEFGKTSQSFLKDGKTSLQRKEPSAKREEKSKRLVIFPLRTHKLTYQCRCVSWGAQRINFVLNGAVEGRIRDRRNGQYTEDLGFEQNERVKHASGSEGILRHWLLAALEINSFGKQRQTRATLGSENDNWKSKPNGPKTKLTKSGFCSIANVSHALDLDCSMESKRQESAVEW